MKTAIGFPEPRRRPKRLIRFSHLKRLAFLSRHKHADEGASMLATSLEACYPSPKSLHN